MKTTQTFEGVPPSILSPVDQTIRTDWREYTEHGDRYRIRATVRYGDGCRNGRNTLSVTGETECASGGRWREDTGGCIHEPIAHHFKGRPEILAAIPFHLVSTDGPMHYPGNVIYHAREHGPTDGWVYYMTPADPLGINAATERLLSYSGAADCRRAESAPGYRVVWDEKTSKTRNLDHARSCAVWPDAPDSILCGPELALRAALAARLPELMRRYHAVVTALGFTY